MLLMVRDRGVDSLWITLIPHCCLLSVTIQRRPHNAVAVYRYFKQCELGWFCLGPMPNSRLRLVQIGQFLAGDGGPLATYKGKHDAIGDALIDPILVLNGDRAKSEFKDIHRA